MITLKKALVEDAENLTNISTDSFNDDARIFLGKEVGPYGYNQMEWHLERMEKCQYYKVMLEDRIVGGLYLSQIEGNHYQVEALFIHPDYQNQKIGTQVIDMMEQIYPKVKKWTLDTPSWNPRTNHFYAKQGYVKTGENDLKFVVLNLYEKILG